MDTQAAVYTPPKPPKLAGAPRTKKQFFQMLAAMLAKSLVLKIIISMLTGAAVFVYNVYLISYVNDTIWLTDRTSAFVAAVANLCANGDYGHINWLNSALFWFMAPSAFFILLFGLIRGPKRFGARMGERARRFKESVTSAPRSVNLSLLLFSVGALLALSSVLLNAFTSLTAVPWLFLFSARRGQGLILTYLRAAKNDGNLKKLKKRRPIGPAGVNEARLFAVSDGAVIGLLLGGLAHLAGTPLVYYIGLPLAGVVMGLAAGNLLFGGRATHAATLLVLACGGALLLAAGPLAITALADDGGWTESGRNILGLFKNAGTPAMLTGCLPAWLTAAWAAFSGAIDDMDRWIKTQADKLADYLKSPEAKKLRQDFSDAVDGVLGHVDSMTGKGLRAAKNAWDSAQMGDVLARAGGALMDAADTVLGHIDASIAPPVVSGGANLIKDFAKASSKLSAPVGRLLGVTDKAVADAFAWVAQNPHLPAAKQLLSDFANASGRAAAALTGGIQNAVTDPLMGAVTSEGFRNLMANTAKMVFGGDPSCPPTSGANIWGTGGGAPPVSPVVQQPSVFQPAQPPAAPIVEQPPVVPPTQPPVAPIVQQPPVVSPTQPPVAPIVQQPPVVPPTQTPVAPIVQQPPVVPPTQPPVAPIVQQPPVVPPTQPPASPIIEQPPVVPPTQPPAAPIVQQPPVVPPTQPPAAPIVQQPPVIPPTQPPAAPIIEQPPAVPPTQPPAAPIVQQPPAVPPTQPPAAPIVQQPPAVPPTQPPAAPIVQQPPVVPPTQPPAAPIVQQPPVVPPTQPPAAPIVEQPPFVPPTQPPAAPIVQHPPVVPPTQPPAAPIVEQPPVVPPTQPPAAPIVEQPSVVPPTQPPAAPIVEQPPVVPPTQPPAAPIVEQPPFVPPTQPPVAPIVEQPPVVPPTQPPVNPQAELPTEALGGPHADTTVVPVPKPAGLPHSERPAYPQTGPEDALTHERIGGGGAPAAYGAPSSHVEGALPMAVLPQGAVPAPETLGAYTLNISPAVGAAAIAGVGLAAGASAAAAAKSAPRPASPQGAACASCGAPLTGPFCVRCGTRAPASPAPDRFCTGCGAKLVGRFCIKCGKDSMG